jgi:hypothetical protein
VIGVAAALALFNLHLFAHSQAGGPTAPPAAPQISASLEAADGPQFFKASVRPILEQKCWPCHSGPTPSAGLNLTRRATVLKGNLNGPVVSLEKPEASLLLKAVNYQGKQMPPQGKLPQKQIDALTRWVKLGLPWQDGDKTPPKLVASHEPPKVTPQTKRFWSFQPVKRPTIPAVKLKGWVRTPVDAFILKGLEAAGLTPNPPASKETLLRRAYYDLTGLPPSPQEVASFVADRSPNAYEKRIDRLLASPRYGEKWGRHWLDLVRYAETNSYERDGTKPNAWRYRDYVIRSFNQDKPYDRFVKEQLAGDEMAPLTPDRLIATGYYRLGIWDDEPADRDQALYDDLDDILGTTGQVFLGLTVNCARCHDHKLDPIPQKDYYRLLAFFAGVTRYGGENMKNCQRPLAPPAVQQTFQRGITAYESKIKVLTEQMEAIEKRIQEDLIPVEKEEFKNPAARLPILQKRVPKLLAQADVDRYSALAKEKADEEQHPPKGLEMALCVVEEQTPRDTFVLMRGNPHVPGEEKLVPGFPQVLSPPLPTIVKPPAGNSSGRRLALANWVASPKNPLTARVMMNRIWQYHFGRGIVRSANNFGLQGDKPTHPELLDWLASEWMANGWKIKPIHRMLMLSSAYRMSSHAQPKELAKDPENDRFWRFDMRRLTAEEVRDSILAVNGSLNPQMGGPSIYPKIPDEVLAGQSMPGNGWTPSTPDQQRRRSVYVFAKRSLMLPILASFDAPEPDFTCPVRFSTTQPTQALGMINSEFVQDQAQVFADNLLKHPRKTAANQVREALQRVLQRDPTSKEVERGAKFIAMMKKEEHRSARDALAAFCLIVLNMNEFIYLD